MNKILARVLSAILLLCMIPAAVITAFAHGPGVAGNLTENQVHDLAQGQFIPETVVVDGKFDDAGWAVTEWEYVNSDNGTWDSERPSQLNSTASYKYQLHYDRNYFYFAAVIALPSGVQNANFVVYLSEQKVDNANHTNRGASAGFVFDIVGNEVGVTAESGYDEEVVDAYNKGTYKPSPEYVNGVYNKPTDNGGKARLADHQIEASVENGIVTIEFRNKLSETVDINFTVYGGSKDMISQYVALELPHGANGETNEAGNEYDMLFYPYWSQGAMEDDARTFEPQGDYWPVKDGGMTPKKVDSAITGITIDGNLEELLWKNANDDFTHVDSSNGHYYVRPYENDPLSYSFVAYSDGSKLYGAAILDVEATAPATDQGKELRGTEFGIWFDNGHDERLDIKTSGQSPCEYEFFKNKTTIANYPSNNGTDNKGTFTSEDYYATEVRYYVNQNCTFGLYGTQFDNNRGGKDEHVDVNPDVAPDYFYDETKKNATIKKNGTHYQYDYKIINGKTYVEFFVDLASVRCDKNDNFKMFVYALHDTADSGTAMGKYAKLYYPSLKTEEQKVQNLFWVTDYNSYGDDIKYGAGTGSDKTRVVDNIGIIFDNFADYDKAAGEYRWWYQVCFKSIGGNKYEVVAIQPSQGEKEGDIAKLPEKPKGNGTYLWYAMNTGDYYSENYWQNNDRKLLAPLDKRNYMAVEAYTQLRKWRIGDEVEFNFDFDDIKTERTVISYDGRMYEVDNATQMNVTNPSKVTTSEPTIQDVGHTRGQYVKFVIKNDTLTFLGEIAVYDEKNTLLSAGKTVTSCHYSPDYGPTSVLTDGSVHSGKYVYNQKNQNNQFYYGAIQTNTSHGHEMVINLGSIQDIHRFGISYACNTQSVDGITCPEDIKIYVSNDNTNWTYAGDVPVKPSSEQLEKSHINVLWDVTYVYSSGTNAEAYYSPFTVTRTFSGESMVEFYERRNVFMPSFEKYGINTDWMYGTTTRIVSAAHIAPDVVKIDGLLGDAGWSADKWIKADADVNATDIGKNIKSQHQIRTDGEYLYVSALVDSANPEFDMWINYNDGSVKKFAIKEGATTLGVQTPDYTGKTRVDNYKLEAADGSTYANGTITYPFSLSVQEWKNGAWSNVAYEDSAFYGTTKELLESTSDGIWIWEGRPQTQGFRFGIESAVIKPSEKDNGAKSVVEFKIALSEIGGANGFRYFFVVKEGANATYYPKIYGEVSDLDNGKWFNTSKVVTAADMKDSGKLWMRNDYAPMTSIGAKVNNAYGENGVKAIRFAARYTEDFIRRSDAKEGTNYWMVADAGIIILPTSMIDKQKGLTLESENIARASALDIVDWKNEAPNGETNFADYESFVFYVNLVDVENIKDVPLSFCGYIDYYENYNGSETFYSIPLERSYSLVEQTANEGQILPK